jgi:hypothetical protein
LSRIAIIQKLGEVGSPRFVYQLRIAAKAA